MKSTRNPISLLIFVLLAILPASPAGADVIQLTNGDRVTGEAVSLSADALIVSTSWAGKITVDWAQVAIFETTRTVTIQWSGYEPFDGNVHVDGEAAEAAALSGDILSSTRGALLGFHVPRPEGEAETAVKHWSGSVDFGGSLTRGNSDTSAVFLGTLFDYINGKHELQLKARGDYSESDGESNSQRWLVGSKYKYNYAERFYTFGLGEVEGDQRSDIAWRARVGGGIGWQIIETERLKWDLEGGVTGTHEDLRGGGSHASINQLWATLVDYRLNSKVSVSQRLQFESPFDDAANFLLTSDSALTTQLWSRFSLKLNLLNVYDNDPPDGKEKNDMLFRTLLSYSF